MLNARDFATCVVALALAGCGDDDRSSPDAAAPDAGNPARDADVMSDGGPQDDGSVAPDGSTAGNVPGRHDDTIVSEGETRGVIIHVPESVRGAVAAPVVVVVHGTGQDGEHFYDESGWRQKADAEGIIAVFPTGLVYCYHEDENGDGDFDDPGEQKVTTKWSSGVFDDRLPPCSTEEIAMLPPDRRALADHPVRDDVAFFGAILDHLESDYVVDSRRFYVTGFSNGASMTSRLALEMSDRFAAAASHAGFLSVDPVPAARPIPMVLSIGSLDDRFTVPMGLAELPVDESFVTLPAFATIVERYLTVLQLRDAHTYSENMAGMRTVARFVYAESTVGADNQLQLAVIEGLHHQYPNGVNHPVSAPDALWQFFEMYSLPP